MLLLLLMKFFLCIVINFQTLSAFGFCILLCMIYEFPSHLLLLCILIDPRGLFLSRVRYSILSTLPSLHLTPDTCLKPALVK